MSYSVKMFFLSEMHLFNFKILVLRCVKQQMIKIVTYTFEDVLYHFNSVKNKN